MNKYATKIDDTLDLHGFTRDEAKIAVENFLKLSKKNNYKKIRIITGKGIHSENAGGILKDYIKQLLDRAGLAYANAKINEGGEGAIDVNLRQ